MKKNMKDCYVKNKGFVSTYIVVILMLICICISIITRKLSSDLKTLNNIEKYNNYFVNEYTIISYFKNKLSEDDIEGTYFINGNNVMAYYDDNQLVLETSGEYNETIYLTIIDNKIFDYYAYRNIDNLYLD